jgi:hypothetical protein
VVVVAVAAVGFPARSSLARGADGVVLLVIGTCPSHLVVDAGHRSGHRREHIVDLDLGAVVADEPSVRVATDTLDRGMILGTSAGGDDRDVATP